MKLAFRFVPENREVLLKGRSKGHGSQPEVASPGQNGDKVRPI